jgi:hypothetical protein
VAAIGLAPALFLFVLGWWALFRGQSAVHDQELILDPHLPPVIPSSFGVMLLLLSLAITVIVLEVLVYNPYHAQLKHAERSLARVRRRLTRKADAAARAVAAHEIAWRDLRSARDEVISFVHTELSRPWQQVILPSRLRHGRATPRSAPAEYGVKIELTPAITDGNGSTVSVEQVRIDYRIFEGMAQPQPGPGPLAEVVRAVLDLDPDPLKAEVSRLEERLHAQFGMDWEEDDPAGQRDEEAGR